MNPPFPQPPTRKADPCAMVTFGVTGDLSRRMLVPALYNLAAADLLTDHFAFVGFGRRKLTTEQFREQLAEDLKQIATTPVPPERWRWLRQRIYYVQGEFTDPAAFRRLAEQVAQVDKDHGTHGNLLHYLAVPPEFFAGIVRHLGTELLVRETPGRWRRVIFEKPFGRDLASARALNAEIREVLSERQIYRIDHFLGKETVQNLLVFRFGNGLFEPVWNRRYIDHVQITATEDEGIRARGGYYDGAGALRDMVPNHLFQLLSLTCMEPPISFNADAVHVEQAKVLHAIQPPGPEDVLHQAVRGQYGEGEIHGRRVPAYRAEPKVRPDSNTETFVALKLPVDNWRWAGVPFYFRTGKRLAQSVTEIAIQFKQAPFQLFRDTPVDCLKTNWLVIRIQPDESISLCFGAKVPGPVLRIGAVEMTFNYADYFGRPPHTGYERLLYDCMIGDATLFQSAEMIEAAWAAVTPVLDVWQSLPPRDFPNYAAGSWGPKDADELLARDGREWRRIEPATAVYSSPRQRAREGEKKTYDLELAHQEP